MARRKIGSGYMLRIRMDDAPRQSLADAALRQDRDLSNLARTLLRDGLARLNAEAAEHASSPWAEFVKTGSGNGKTDE